MGKRGRERKRVSEREGKWRESKGKLNERDRRRERERQGTWRE